MRHERNGCAGRHRDGPGCQWAFVPVFREGAAPAEPVVFVLILPFSWSTQEGYAQYGREDFDLILLPSFRC